MKRVAFTVLAAIAGFAATSAAAPEAAAGEWGKPGYRGKFARPWMAPRSTWSYRPRYRRPWARFGYGRPWAAVVPPYYAYGYTPIYSAYAVGPSATFLYGAPFYEGAFYGDGLRAYSYPTYAVSRYRSGCWWADCFGARYAAYASPYAYRAYAYEPAYAYAAYSYRPSYAYSYAAYGYRPYYSYAGYGYSGYGAYGGCCRSYYYAGCC